MGQSAISCGLILTQILGGMGSAQGERGTCLGGILSKISAELIILISLPEHINQSWKDINQCLMIPQSQYGQHPTIAIDVGMLQPFLNQMNTSINPIKSSRQPHKKSGEYQLKNQYPTTFYRNIKIYYIKYYFLIDDKLIIIEF